MNLISRDGLWEIADINCTSGEEAPDQGEFTFDREGFLLKQSVPPPLDPQFWYLVFEQEGTPGHTAPLLLGDESTCVNDDREGSCSDDMLGEALRAHVQGNLTEAGVDVARIEILK